MGSLFRNANLNKILDMLKRVLIDFDTCKFTTYSESQMLKPTSVQTKAAPY